MSKAVAIFGRWVLIIAMMGSIGGHWLVLQSVAWTTMIIDRAKTECISTALSDTFDGQHPCPLCQSIKKGRDTEKRQDAQVMESKMNLFLEVRSIVLISPVHQSHQQVSDIFAESRSMQPVLQPPRVTLA